MKAEGSYPLPYEMKRLPEVKRAATWVATRNLSSHGYIVWDEGFFIFSQRYPKPNTTIFAAVRRIKMEGDYVRSKVCERESGDCETEYSQ